MRVLEFDAKVEVYLEASSSRTMEELAELVEDEFYVNFDLPQGVGEFDFGVQEIHITTSVAEKPPISDAEYYNIPDEDEDESQEWEGEGI